MNVAVSAFRARSSHSVLIGVLGALVQIWLGLTNHVSTVHRALGKVYGAGVRIGSLGGFSR